MAKASKKISHPWISIATLCEKSLVEKDDVISVIRMVDRFTVPRPPEWDGKTPIGLPLCGMLGLRSGGIKGSRTVRIYGTSPNGKRKKIQEVPIEFLGGDSGVNIRLSIMFGFKAEGTHWFDVYIDKWHATRIPITIVFAEAPQAESSASDGQPSP
jgi:hypothetical protein